MKILITGSNGFVGRNFVEFLKTKENIELYLYDKDNTLQELERFCKDCDVVVNLAGVNRTTNNEEFVEGNLGVIENVVNFLSKSNNKAPIIYSSSIQAERDNDYGKSKKLGEDFLFTYSKKNNVPVYVYRFTNLFGKWCRPNYNSVIATFCHNIARDLPITINDRNAEITFCYIDDVVKEIYSAVCGNANKKDEFCYVEETYKKTIGEVADLINGFKQNRNTLAVINTADLFEKKLYSTYLSFLPEESFGYSVKMNVDNRGSFTELLKSESSGQVSVNVAKPGITKGNHWHNTKNEKFIVVQGEAVIKFRKPFEKEVIEYKASGEKIEIIDIPCGYTHSITNIGKTDLVFIIWVNELFDKENPDTYYLEV
ncbi:MAG: NAD-dependent epimerase/dehydratase family protein [Clostridia bacterium]|nr:NAD-dependent epimerase/dehydratase family protein [Clostridia bacterium]